VASKPPTRAGYPLSALELVRQTCLYAATVLGDLLGSIAIVGGLAPSLIVDQARLPVGAEPHVGTLDLDLGLHVAVLDAGFYRAISERLRRAGFSPALNERGNPSRQTWEIRGPTGACTVDFLIPPTRPNDEGGRLRDLESDFAAIIAPGLPLAFRDQIEILLDGRTILGERARRTVNVTGPGAYVVLKALAFANRGEPKDAFDLFYVVRNYGRGIHDVAERLAPLLDDPAGREAVDVLRRDFVDHDGPGAARVARFLRGALDDDLQADVVGVVAELLRLLESG
jgi:hypothetical protein